MKKIIKVERINNNGYRNKEGEKLAIGISFPYERIKTIGLPFTDVIMLTEEDAKTLQKQLKRIEKEFTKNLF